MRPDECQIHCLQRVFEAEIDLGPQPLSLRLNLAVTRRLSPRAKRRLKDQINSVYGWYSRFAGRSKLSPSPTSNLPASSLKAGDMVRVRSREEIQATLNIWNELRGCGYLDGMWQYCDTVQRVLKPLERFLDEREFRMKRCKGIVLLEGLTCEGIPEVGRCDRSCYFFWREEWLEKLEDGNV
jgi:hypothetical protein